MATEQFSLVELIDNICAEKNIVSQPLRVARDIMNKEVRTLTLDHSVNACITLMKNLRIRHVPVVDPSCENKGKPSFVGVVSERDVLRLTFPSVGTPGEQNIDPQALRQLLVQIVARNPKTVLPETPIHDVIMTMLHNRIDMVPVLDDADVVGIITTVDIIKIFSRLDKAIQQLCPELFKATQPTDLVSVTSSQAEVLFSWACKTVQDIMTEQVISLRPQDDLSMAMQLMQEREVRHVPIIDEQGKLQGVVSDRDILRHLHFAGRRPLWQPKKFRDHLFSVDPTSVKLRLPLERIMMRKVTHVLPDCSICDAAQTLRKMKASCLPVVDEESNIRGIVAVTDLMNVLPAIYEVSVKSHV